MSQSESQGSAVGIATGYGLEDKEVRVRVPVGTKTFISPCPPYRLWGSPGPPIHWLRGALSPGVKRPGHEADHSSPPNTEA
jgi:hypothetical protein